MDVHCNYYGGWQRTFQHHEKGARVQLQSGFPCQWIQYTRGIGEKGDLTGSLDSDAYLRSLDCFNSPELLGGAIVQVGSIIGGYEPVERSIIVEGIQGILEILFLCTALGQSFLARLLGRSAWTIRMFGMETVASGSGSRTRTHMTPAEPNADTVEPTLAIIGRFYEASWKIVLSYKLVVTMVVRV